MNKQRFNLEAMERGQQASTVHAIVLPYINERITVYVQQMASAYRGGTFTHDHLVGKVAEITALLDLISNLENQQRAGDIAAEREMSSGKA